MKLAIVFDLDGTLIDTPRGIVESFTVALNSMNVEPVDPSAIRATIGLPLEKAFSSLLDLPDDDALVAHAVKQYQAAFKNIVLPKAKELIFPGVAEGLTKLKQQGHPIAVATSKVHKSAAALLEAAGLWDLFDFVICADHVSQPKPHPEMGHLVMEKLGVSGSHSIMVGDTTHDMLMARDSGMHSIAVTYGIHNLETLQTSSPNWIADNFDDVINHVRVFNDSLVITR